MAQALVAMDVAEIAREAAANAIRTHLNPLRARALTDLTQAPDQILHWSEELANATLAHEELEQEYARLEELAMEAAVNDAANTNELKRKLAAKTILMQDSAAHDARQRLRNARIAVQVHTRNLATAQNRFRAAQSLAIMLGQGDAE